MAYLHSNIPYFKAWVRREYTHNHESYHGEFLHAMVIGVTTIPNRCLSFQVIFTGNEAEGEEEDTVHGGALETNSKRKFNGKNVPGTAVARGCGKIISNRRKRTTGAVSQS